MPYQLLTEAEILPLARAAVDEAFAGTPVAGSPISVHRRSLDIDPDYVEIAVALPSQVDRVNPRMSARAMSSVAQQAAAKGDGRVFVMRPIWAEKAA
jgi:hypothetical protein